MRAWCWTSYPDLPQRRVLGYVMHNGGVTTQRLAAKVYASEAEAWEHAQLADLLGHDEQGDWCPGTEPA